MLTHHPSSPLPHCRNTCAAHNHPCKQWCEYIKIWSMCILNCCTDTFVMVGVTVKMCRLLHNILTVCFISIISSRWHQWATISFLIQGQYLPDTHRWLCVCVFTLYCCIFSVWTGSPWYRNVSWVLFVRVCSSVLLFSFAIVPCCWTQHTTLWQLLMCVYMCQI